MLNTMNGIILKKHLPCRKALWKSVCSLTVLSYSGSVHYGAPKMIRINNMMCRRNMTHEILCVYSTVHQLPWGSGNNLLLSSSCSLASEMYCDSRRMGSTIRTLILMFTKNIRGNLHKLSSKKFRVWNKIIPARSVVQKIPSFRKISPFVASSINSRVFQYKE